MCSIYRYEISIVDISTLLKNIDIDKDNLENIDIYIEKTILENIAIDINKDYLENIDIDIDKYILKNINIYKDNLGKRIIFSTEFRLFS